MLLIFIEIHFLCLLFKYSLNNNNREEDTQNKFFKMMKQINKILLIITADTIISKMVMDNNNSKCKNLIKMRSCKWDKIKDTNNN